MLRRTILFTSLAAAVLAGGAGAIAHAVGDSEGSLSKALAVRLPKTPLTAIDCAKIEGLCEVQSGANLFYTDRAGRFLMVGRVYDMETRHDLTAARLLEISPETLVSGAAKAAAIESPEGSSPTTTSQSVAAGAERVSIADLPASGAITWGSGAQTVTVFSDFRCGYCGQLHQALAGMNVTVIERPISVLGTRSISDAVICSQDRVKAVEKAYKHEPLGPTRRCDTSGLDANEGFARTHGFTGTPVIVRSDGAVVHGYRPPAFLAAWLKEAR
jgi:thiol:disulfide interchange protein DsbC